MSDPTDVQEYIDKINARRRADDAEEEEGDDGPDPTSGGLYGGGTWENTDNDRLGGYTGGGG